MRSVLVLRDTISKENREKRNEQSPKLRNSKSMRSYIFCWHTYAASMCFVLRISCMKEQQGERAFPRHDLFYIVAPIWTTAAR